MRMLVRAVTFTDSTEVGRQIGRLASERFTRTQPRDGKHPMVVLRDADLNVHTAYKEPQHSFGGVKQSGFRLPEAGATGVQFFQHNKAIYVRKRGSLP